MPSILRQEQWTILLRWPPSPCANFLPSSIVALVLTSTLFTIANEVDQASSGFLVPLIADSSHVPPCCQTWARMQFMMIVRCAYLSWHPSIRLNKQFGFKVNAHVGSRSALWRRATFPTCKQFNGNNRKCGLCCWEDWLGDLQDVWLIVKVTSSGVQNILLRRQYLV